jgi:hypothetical protein
MLEISSVAKQLASFRRTLQVARETSSSLTDLYRGIDEQIEWMAQNVHTTEGDPRPYMHVMARAMQLFVRPAWAASWSTTEDTDELAPELARPLRQLRETSCSPVDLIMWQLFIGCIAAQDDHPTRMWFLSRLKRVFDLRLEWYRIPIC